MIYKTFNIFRIELHERRTKRAGVMLDIIAWREVSTEALMWGGVGRPQDLKLHWKAWGHVENEEEVTSSFLSLDAGMS
ncbi:MAG: hypothetical protein U9N01_04320 [Euryarchaeota archaeon]|nr:hypothetical protein [Euryarchaeota archaeon]